jgi:antitoxin (DNA-binding transcriptional repressor) of toxin-antitoxin stability system
VVVRVGTRELRENLRAYLAQVKDGDELAVTERGKVIARVVQPGSDDDHIARLIRQGTITPAKRPKQPIDRSKLVDLGPGPSLSDIVIAMRRGMTF